MDADAKRPGEGSWPNVDTCRQVGKGSKIGKILRTSFMDNGWPLRSSVILIATILSTLIEYTGEHSLL